MTAEKTFNKVVKEDAKKIDNLLKRSKLGRDVSRVIDSEHPAVKESLDSERNCSLPAEKPLKPNIQDHRVDWAFQAIKIAHDDLAKKCIILQHDVELLIEDFRQQIKENEALKNGIRTSLPEIRKQAIIVLENRIIIRIKERIKAYESVRDKRLERVDVRTDKIGKKQLFRTAVKYKGKIAGLNEALEIVSRIAEIERE